VGVRMGEDGIVIGQIVSQNYVFYGPKNTK